MKFMNPFLRGKQSKESGLSTTSSQSKAKELEIFNSTIEEYKNNWEIKDNKNTNIRHVKYKLAIDADYIGSNLERDACYADCLLCTYKNRDLTGIFDKLKDISRERELKGKGLPSNTRYIARIYDCVYDGTNTYVIQEFINGDNLEAVASHRLGGKLTEREVINIGKDICRALEVLHKNKILHMDIKPENIIAKADTSGYKLIDFNGSVIEDEDMAPGEYSYTPGFNAPEHNGIGTPDETTDLSSLGKTMYKLYTGEDYVPGCISSKSGFLNSLYEVIYKSTRMDKENKYYHSASDMLHDLETKSEQTNSKLRHENREMSKQVKDLQEEIEKNEKYIERLDRYNNELDNTINELQELSDEQDDMLQAYKRKNRVLIVACAVLVIAVISMLAYYTYTIFGV